MNPVEHLIDVLREAFEGPKEKWSYFTDNSPEAGLIGSLAHAAYHLGAIQQKLSFTGMETH